MLATTKSAESNVENCGRSRRIPLRFLTIARIAGAGTARIATAQLPDMLTVAVWDLGESRKPGSTQVPRVLRRIGADVVALANHTATNTDSIARNCGYRHRAKVFDAGTSMAVLSRFPLSDAVGELTPAGTVAKVSIHMPHGPLRLVLADFDRRHEEVAAGVVRHELDAWERAILVTGGLGHDLANPHGPWAILRREVVDLVELSGGEPGGERLRGILGRGVEARGAGTMQRAGGGETELIWARISL